MIRYLCFDLGDKRTGVAVGDTLLRIASPLTVLEVPIAERDGGSLLNAIARVCDEQLGAIRASISNMPAPPPQVILGLPLNMDGTEGSRSKLVRAFGLRIESHTRRTIMFRDERLSTAAADWTMSQSGLTHKQKKARRDALAAANILQSFLNESGPAQAGPLESN